MCLDSRPPRGEAAGLRRNDMLKSAHNILHYLNKKLAFELALDKTVEEEEKKIEKDYFRDHEGPAEARISEYGEVHALLSFFYHALS